MTLQARRVAECAPTKRNGTTLCKSQPVGSEPANIKASELAEREVSEVGEVESAVHGAVPAVDQAEPEVHQPVPEVDELVLAVDEAVPRVKGAVAKVERAVPAVHDEVPAATAATQRRPLSSLPQIINCEAQLYAVAPPAPHRLPVGEPIEQSPYGCQ
ncbi:hypothetical protein BDK51DRAFT_49589 [Blyttiomyces helicus]|uniref:Uncharacterized protein n=1 Tax=Blyttiomyces helicus TaxID=388810 RepID=A0A4P9WEK8_9FUNG|nr:hypothetical protein BDK51DRAFT_49589 [Blyttiomyces helicus]|eukprot:RKO90832.1 hypothetical protein BDK51DRAFT_49589 [Blyttiomyces helicus]